MFSANVKEKGPGFHPGLLHLKQVFKAEALIGSDARRIHLYAASVELGP